MKDILNVLKMNFLKIIKNSNQTSIEYMIIFTCLGGDYSICIQDETLKKKIKVLHNLAVNLKLSLLKGRKFMDFIKDDEVLIEMIMISTNVIHNHRDTFKEFLDMAMQHAEKNTSQRYITTCNTSMEALKLADSFHLMLTNHH